MKKIQTVQLILSILISVILIFLFTRAISPKELDDVSPRIPCQENLIEKSDVLWIIPKFNNTPISEDKQFCAYISSLNKTLGLHGYQHTYQEFGKPVSQSELNDAITIFQDCLNQTPMMFKPPQLKISDKNKKLIHINNLKLELDLNQISHKVYHCSDTGTFSNKFIDWF
jgi:predicted deacetylase